MSLFSTKTPYYPLQILSLISINSYLGIEKNFNGTKKLLEIFKLFFIRYLPNYFNSCCFLYKRRKY